MCVGRSNLFIFLAWKLAIHIQKCPDIDPESRRCTMWQWYYSVDSTLDALDILQAHTTFCISLCLRRVIAVQSLFCGSRQNQLDCLTETLPPLFTEPPQKPPFWITNKSLQEPYPTCIPKGNLLRFQIIPVLIILGGWVGYGLGMVHSILWRWCYSRVNYLMLHVLR